MKLGAIRLTERFFSAAIADRRTPTAKEVDECRHYVRAALAPVGAELGGHQPEIAIGSSGTATTIAAMAAAERGDDVRADERCRLHRRRADAAVVERVITAKDRSRVAGLDDKRADIILGGAILLDEVFRVFGLDVDDDLRLRAARGRAVRSFRRPVRA